MAVEHALGLAGGARGVTHATGPVFVDADRLERRVAAGKKALIVFEFVGFTTVIQNDHPLKSGLVGELSVERQQDIIENQNPVFGVIGDVGNIVGVQSQV